MSVQPSLFISHGSPMIALERDDAVVAWRQLAKGLERPAAILLISAHWEAHALQVTSAPQLSTIHDFAGFPEALYRLHYPAAGSPDLAMQIAERLSAGGFSVQLNPQRGLDHGAWIPLREMFPEADIPVLQLSLQTQRGADYHYRLGQVLAPLLAQNILVVGSGAVTHNLHDWMLAMRGNQTALDYVPAFQQWVYAMLCDGNIDALLSYREVSEYGARAHPSEEHLLPLFVALGAAGENAQITREYDSIANGALGMDAYRFQPTV